MFSCVFSSVFFSFFFRFFFFFFFPLVFSCCFLTDLSLTEREGSMGEGVGGRYVLKLPESVVSILCMGYQCISISGACSCFHSFTASRINNTFETRNLTFRNYVRLSEIFTQSWFVFHTLTRLRTNKYVPGMSGLMICFHRKQKH